MIVISHTLQKTYCTYCPVLYDSKIIICTTFIRISVLGERLFVLVSTKPSCWNLYEFSLLVAYFDAKTKRVRLYDLVDPASSHTLVLMTKPCMPQCEICHVETANSSLERLQFTWHSVTTRISTSILELIHYLDLDNTEGLHILDIEPVSFGCFKVIHNFQADRFKRRSV